MPLVTPDEAVTLRSMLGREFNAGTTFQAVEQRFAITFQPKDRFRVLCQALTFIDVSSRLHCPCPSVGTARRSRQVDALVQLVTPATRHTASRACTTDRCCIIPMRGSVLHMHGTRVAGSCTAFWWPWWGYPLLPPLFWGGGARFIPASF
jgi:hypothetical protein